MRTLPCFAAAAAGVVLLASCATAPRTRAPRGKTQELLLRSDPAGASCSNLRDGVAVASGEATRGIAIVPRRNAPIDVVCRKEGYLEMRARFEVASATAVAATRAWIDGHCRPWPCQASDAEACPAPYCEGLRVDVDEELNVPFDQASGLRAQTRIVAP